MECDCPPPEIALIASLDLDGSTPADTNTDELMSPPLFWNELLLPRVERGLEFLSDVGIELDLCSDSGGDDEVGPLELIFDEDGDDGGEALLDGPRSTSSIIAILLTTPPRWEFLSLPFELSLLIL